MRNSGQKICGVGTMKKMDWSRQSELTRKNKPTRRKCYKGQVYMGNIIPVNDCTVNRVEMVTIRDDDGKPLGTRARGYINDILVERQGYGYSRTLRGRTPGLWYPVK